MTPPSLPQHQRDLVFHAQEYAAEVDLHYSIPLLLGDICRGENRLFDPALLKAKSSRLNSSGALSSAAFTSSARDTSHPTANTRPPSSSIFAGGLLVAFFRNIGDHHARALARECQRRGATRSPLRSQTQLCQNKSRGC